MRSALPKNKILEFTIYLLTIVVIFPSFNKYTNIPVGWPGSILLIFYVLLRMTSIFNKKVVVISFIILAFLAFQIISKDFYIFMFTNFEEFTHRYFTYFVPAILIETLIKYNNVDFNLRLGKIALILLTVSAFIHMATIIQYPILARISNPELIAQYPWWVSALPFGLMNSYPFILGLMILVTKWQNIVHIFIIILLLIVALYTGFFTALTFAIAISGASLMIRLGIKKVYLFLFILFILILIISLKLEILNFAKYIPNETIQGKILGIEERINTGEGNSSIETREDVYMISWKSFLNNMFIGQGSALKVGGHSYWLDKLSMLGIMGTLPFIFFFIAIYKRSLVLLNTRLHYLFKIQIFITFFFMFLNPYEFVDYFSIIFIFSILISNYVANKNTFELNIKNNP